MYDLKQFNQLMKLDYTQDYLRSVLGDKAPQFVTNITALVANDKMLQKCNPTTIMHAAITATALDLPINKSMGTAYVIPYKDEAQFQMGYKGFIQLAMRTGQFVRLNATDVREGELKGFNRLSGDITFEWDDSEERVNKKVIGYVAYFRLVNGFSKSLYMSVAEVEKHAQRYSQTYRNERSKASSKWATDFDAMALKTVLKQLLSKYAPLSVEMTTAIQADQSVQREAGEYSYVDNRDATKAELAERAKERAMVEDAESEDIVDESTGEVKPIDPTVNDLPFED